MSKISIMTKERKLLFFYMLRRIRIILLIMGTQQPPEEFEYQATVSGYKKYERILEGTINLEVDISTNVFKLDGIEFKGFYLIYSDDMGTYIVDIPKAGEEFIVKIGS